MSEYSMWLRKLSEELKTIGYLLSNDPHISFDSNKVVGGTLDAISKSMNIIANDIEELEGL